ncbi:MAG: AEC family transporter [Thermovirga sp.]
MNSGLMVLPLALVMELGVLFRRVGMLSEETVPHLNAILYWAALPALLFRSILKVGSGIFADPNLFWAVHVSFLVVPGVAWLMAMPFTRDRKRIAVSVLVAIRSNNVFMGIPAITIALGQEGLEALSLFLAVGLLGYNFISITWAQVALSGSVSIRSLFATFKQLLKNPLILACFFGVAGSSMGFSELPGWLDSTLKIIGDTGSGVALIALGASLHFSCIGQAFKSAWRESFFKLFIHPAIVWAAFLVWPVAPVLRNTVILLSAMPAAINTFVIAQNMGMDADFAAEIVALSTAFSIISLPLWIAMLVV